MHELIDKLVLRCMQDVEDFYSLGSVQHTRHGPLIHIDNGGDTLAVAHLDTIGDSVPKLFLDADGDYGVTCIQLDDRLGVWVLLDLLPRYTEVKYDILLTDSEEYGDSTARYFEPEKQYNWIWEFDRPGIDVVTYQYDTPGVEDLLYNYGFEHAQGTYTDIVELSHLGVQGFNIGTGYYDQHTKHCEAYFRDTLYMVAMFRRMLEEQHGTKMPWKPSAGQGALLIPDLGPDGKIACESCGSILHDGDAWEGSTQCKWCDYLEMVDDDDEEEYFNATIC